MSGVAADFTNPATPFVLAQFSSRERPYKVVGTMETQGTWVVNNNENIVIFVDGNLRINGEIRTQGRSFIAFIVNGDITISSNVGSPVGNNNPNVSGIFVTSTAGRFNTGTTTSNGSARLIIDGTVIAGGINLQRDLAAQNANTTTPAEEFRYNPMFLFTMPNEFKEMKISWQEMEP